MCDNIVMTDQDRAAWDMFAASAIQGLSAAGYAKASDKPERHIAYLAARIASAMMERRAEEWK